MITPISTNNVIPNQQSFKGINSKKLSEAVAENVVILRDMVTASNKKTERANNLKKRLQDVLHNAIAEKVVAPVMNSKLMNRCADKSVNIDNIGAHMATAGSIVTTAVYANRTLHKKELDKKRARTLALNQCLVTVLSTIGAYTINSKLDKLSKNLGYKFREANQGSKALSKRMQGFNLAKQLLIFTCMYRYIAPVIVTPIASKIGKLLDKDKNGAAQSVQNAPAVAPTNARDNFYKNLEMLKTSNK